MLSSPLRMVSLMADNSACFYRALARYLSRRIGIPMEVEESVPWQERERMLDRGKAQLGVICGLPYVQKADRPDPHLELLAAPVMAGTRYAGQPVYFSDVVVHKDSPFHRFNDLRGAAWAYNEPNSHSGYNLTRYHLARLGEHRGFFSRITEAGDHQTALRLVIDGTVDASAIDSTVLELELMLDPELASFVRVIDTLGPSPIPPAVISRQVPEATRRALRAALLEMDQDSEGQEILAGALAARFVLVSDRYYDAIRQMTREAAPVRWTSPVLPHAPPRLPQSASRPGADPPSMAAIASSKPRPGRISAPGDIAFHAEAVGD